MARQIAAALKMSLEERRERLRAMVRRLRRRQCKLGSRISPDVLSACRALLLKAATQPIVLDLAQRRAALNRVKNDRRVPGFRP